MKRKTQNTIRKNFVNISLIIFLILNINGCSKDENRIVKSDFADFKSISENFANPHQDFGTVPFFVWNGKITKERIENDLKEFKEAGFGGVFIHPRPGLITEYLSKDWFELFVFNVEKAKELDLNIWIYDENSYPSGFAGGHVPAQMPESYENGQGLEPIDTNVIPTNIKDYFLIYEKINGEYQDITNIAANNIGKKGEYSLLKKTYFEKSGWFGGWSYVDLLYPGVTEKFIDVTMTGYKNISGKDFGKSIKGVFTDEPEINTHGGIRWTPDLFEFFMKLWNYDLKDHLPSLYKEVGNWKKIRHNYTQTLLQLFIERWSKPQYKYCEENNLIFTGHYWEHGWPSMKLGGDNMAMYAYHQMPGIDMLFNQFDEVSNRAQFGNIRSVKELASVANQLGRKRTLSETYGGGGWEETFKDFKKLGDWEYVLGVNFMNQHLSHYTLTGARKYDYPPSFSYHTPYWKNYKYLNDYYKRLSFVLSSGEQKNDILIIEPTTSAWVYDSYIDESINKNIDSIGLSFQKFVTTLEKNQVEYDLGSEDIIKNHGSIDGTKFIIGERKYSTVVIPPLLENLNLSTFDLIKKFISGGGKVVSFSTPQLIDGEVNQDLINLFSQKNKNHFNFVELNSEIIKNHFSNGNIQFSFNGGNFYHHRRILNDGQILFLVNSSLDEKTVGEILINGKDAKILNPFNGKINDVAETKINDKIKLSFELEPAQSMLLFISNSEISGFSPIEIKNEFAEINSTTEIKIKRIEDNALMIDFCDLQINGRTFKELNVYDAGTKVFKENGFENGNPWNTSVQFKTSILDRGNFSKESGFTAIYNFVIEDNFDFTNIKSVVERPEIWEVYINEQKVLNEKNKWWLDKDFGVYNIGNWVKQGKNKIEVKCYPMNIHAEIEPIYIVGNFSVEAAAKGWKIKSPLKEMKMSSWKNQGMPFYSWGVNYRKEFSISKKTKYFISLNDWKGTVASIFVNGKDAGIIALDSDKLNVTEFLVNGNNKIDVKILGSLKNLLGPHHKNPQPGLVSPWHWRGTEGYPSGNQYQLLDYGLFGDIKLYEVK
ncbi:MAG: glycosyl hydrolase [Melioribacteraceae bacterium]